MTASVDEYRHRFTDFYASLTTVFPDVFSEHGLRRIGSTFRVPGAGGLDAQTFYMRHVLEMVFSDRQLVGDLVTLARCAYRGSEPPAEAVERVMDGHVHETLYRATEAASTLTGSIGGWKEGTDLFANILTNTDCALQMAGILGSVPSHAARSPAKSSATTMDQAAIDALFG